MQEIRKQPKFRCLLVSAAMFVNLLWAFGAMFAFPHETNSMRAGAIMTVAALAVFAFTLFGIRQMVDHCWERCVLVLFGGLILTMFWILLLIIVYFIVLYVTGGSIM